MATVQAAGRRRGITRGTAGTTTTLGTGIPGTGTTRTIIPHGMAGVIGLGVIMAGIRRAIMATTVTIAHGMAVAAIVVPAAVRGAVQALRTTRVRRPGVALI